MSLFDDYRLPAEEIQLDDVVGPLRILARQVDRLTEASDSLQQSVLSSTIASLDQAVCRLRGAGAQLYRELQRRVDEATDPEAAQHKRRLPRVAKSLTAPGEGLALLSAANEARKAGRLDRWIREERRRQATAR